jgi:hypothetical protein
MPHLQSIVIVLLKVILTNVTAMVTQPGQNGVNLGYVLLTSRLRLAMKG